MPPARPLTHISPQVWRLAKLVGIQIYGLWPKYLSWSRQEMRGWSFKHSDCVTNSTLVFGPFINTVTISSAFYAHQSWSSIIIITNKILASGAKITR
ncbi:hypothetical protein J1614_009755 [Plenodomus biglobosus]|nr:hypothetical protein J1614_009755 [Plenodomus biglobosus]